MDENLDVTVAIAEANNSLQLQYGGMDAVKTNARQLFSSASLILSLVTLLQLNRPVSPIYVGYYIVGLVLAALMYLTVVFISIYIISPVVLKTPIQPKWEVYQEYLFQKQGRELQLIRLSAYLNAFDQNLSILDKRICLFRIASIFFVSLVVLLLGISVVPSLPA